jgi:cytochrome c oxidase subunit 1
MSIPSSVLVTGPAREASPGIYPGVVAYIAIAGVVLLLMMLLGVVLRLAQAEWLPVPPDLFYEMMTAHGAGMVGIAGLAGAGIMWHFLSRYVRLNRGILVANLVSFFAGVLMILAAIFLGDFGGGWTFLYPLPATSGGAWEAGAAALYLGGLLVVGVAFCCFISMPGERSSLNTARSARRWAGPSCLAAVRRGRRSRPSSPAQW